MQCSDRAHTSGKLGERADWPVDGALETTSIRGSDLVGRGLNFETVVLLANFAFEPQVNKINMERINR